MKAILLSLIMALGFGCKPEQQETQFNEVNIPRQISLADEQPLCSQIQGEQECVQAQDCQPVNSEDGSDFISCVQTPIQVPPQNIDDLVDDEQPNDEQPNDEQPNDEQPNDEQPNDEQPNDEQPNDEQPNDEQPNDEQPQPNDEEPTTPEVPVEQPEDPIVSNPTQEAHEACSKGKGNGNKVAICHIPSGNPAALHTICVSKQGWLNGHKDRHGSEESRDYLGACTQRDLDVYGASE